jgi:hypothetical protein
LPVGLLIRKISLPLVALARAVAWLQTNNHEVNRVRFMIIIYNNLSGCGRDEARCEGNECNIGGCEAGVSNTRFSHWIRASVLLSLSQRLTGCLFKNGTVKRFIVKSV